MYKDLSFELVMDGLSYRLSRRFIEEQAKYLVDDYLKGDLHDRPTRVVPILTYATYEPVSMDCSWKPTPKLHLLVQNYCGRSVQVAVWLDAYSVTPFAEAAKALPGLFDVVFCPAPHTPFPGDGI